MLGAEVVVVTELVVDALFIDALLLTILVGVVAAVGDDVIFVTVAAAVAEEIIDDFIGVSFVFDIIDVLLLLFALLFAFKKLPFKTLRGNGFGLITSTK